MNAPRRASRRRPRSGGSIRRDSDRIEEVWWKIPSPTKTIHHSDAGGGAHVRDERRNVHRVAAWKQRDRPADGHRRRRVVTLLGRATSKVCFWDTQSLSPTSPRVLPNAVFTLGPNEQIPIGVPDLSIDSQGRAAMGGYDLDTCPAANGVCTDCHAGGNPFIIHPTFMSRRRRVDEFGVAVRAVQIRSLGPVGVAAKRSVAGRFHLIIALPGLSWQDRNRKTIAASFLRMCRICACILPSAIGP